MSATDQRALDVLLVIKRQIVVHMRGMPAAEVVRPARSLHICLIYEKLVATLWDSSRSFQTRPS